MLEWISALSRCHSCQFWGKTDKLDFLDPNLPKNEFWGCNFKDQSPNSESALPRYHVCQFSVQTDNFDFFGPNLPKKKIKIEIQKTNVGIRISMFEIPCVPIFRQNGHLWLFGPKFAQKWIVGSEFQKSMSGFRISIIEILYVPILRQNRQL